MLATNVWKPGAVRGRSDNRSTHLPLCRLFLLQRRRGVISVRTYFHRALSVSVLFRGNRVKATLKIMYPFWRRRRVCIDLLRCEISNLPDALLVVCFRVKFISRGDFMYYINFGEGVVIHEDGGFALAFFYRLDLHDWFDQVPAGV